MTLTKEQLQYLDRFGRSDGATLVTILRAMLAERDAQLRKARGEDVIRTQGRAQELDELIVLITTAGQKLKRNEASPMRPPSTAP